MGRTARKAHRVPKNGCGKPLCGFPCAVLGVDQKGVDVERSGNPQNISIHTPQRTGFLSHPPKGGGNIYRE